MRTVLRFVLFTATLGILVPGEFCSGEHDGPVVQTGKGVLKGAYKESRNLARYEQYLGIKYGEVPQRFAPSVPAGEWDGVKEATAFAPMCAQWAAFSDDPDVSVVGEEDCLFLNVFTPKADDKKRGVLVFIHGGGFFAGIAAQFGGGFLVDEDIVLVTVNYRLGILGFLNNHDGVANGNMGLKDQILALQWVQENIESFGGDPNRVTISGQSAGGAAVLYLLISPLAKGLFSGVYSMSGSILSSWAFGPDPTESVTAVAKRLQCETNTADSVLECFQQAPINKLLTAQGITIMPLALAQSSIPSVETKSAANPNPFIDRAPADILSTGDFPNIPVLVTMTRDESSGLSVLLTRNETLLAELANNFEEMAPTVLGYAQEPSFQKCKNPELVAQEILKFYFQNQPLTRESEQNLTKLTTDSWCSYAIYKTIKQLSSYTTVYAGLFNRPTANISFFGLDNIGDYVNHCDDLRYIFDATDVPVPALVDLGTITLKEDIEFSKKMVQLVANFVKTGTPSLPFEGSPVWDPVSPQDKSDFNWFTIDEHPKRADSLIERIQFWELVYEKCASEPPKRQEL